MIQVSRQFTNTMPYGYEVSILQQTIQQVAHQLGLLQDIKYLKSRNKILLLV